MRILCLIALTVIAGTYTTYGQVRSEFFRSLFVEVTGNGGLMSEKIKAIPFSTNYTDALNTYQSGIKFKNGTTAGANLNLGYYFNAQRSLGVGVGVNYQKMMGDLTMDSFHVEFRSTDFQGGTFRQVISTSHKIKESVTTTSINIPLLLMYKKNFSEDLFLTVDAGIVYNVQAKNTYNTDAEFNYEAIYRYEGTTPVYDYSPTPDQSDFLLTKSFYTTKYPNGDVVAQFNQWADTIGYSVGLKQKAKAKNETIKFKSGSLGFTAQAAINFKLVKNVYARAGGFYTMQSFSNTSNNNAQRLTDQKLRDANGYSAGVNYNSLLNEVQTVNASTYGLFIGVRVYINRTAWKYMENDMDKITPAKGHGQ